MQNLLFENDAIEQFLMTRFQVFNWGTFSGLHDIAISTDGHLFIGGSGSGKSTLLDAMSVLLTPGPVNFNAAAREGERKSDRTLLSYMRGAWTTQQDEEGRSVIQYLRNQSTWTALALTYKSAVRTVTLLFIGFIRGNTNDDARVTRRYYVIPHEMDLSELSDFSARNYDWGFVSKKLPEAKHYLRFTPYCEAFRKVFGIEEETVFKLLHKAQSARNLGDLNEFLRKFMLDVPKTFEVADTLVSQFTELYEAHELVVKARHQVEVLSDAQEHYQAYEKAQRQKASLEELRMYLPTWILGQRQSLLNVELPLTRQKEEDAQATYNEKTRVRTETDARIDSLTRQYYAKGGDRLNQAKMELEHAKNALASATRKRSRFEEKLQPLELELPNTFDEFTQIQRQLKDLRENGQAQFEACKQKHDEAFLEKSQLSKEFQELSSEIRAMESSSSNIPSHLLALRTDLAQTLNIAETALPFVGELLEVKEEESAWQGAAERLLHNFATSILVDDAHYREFVSLVNSRHLGARLVFHRVKRPNTSPLTVDDASLFYKLNIKEGYWATWLERELAERFDYTCVDSIDDFMHHARALTVKGQIKHNQTRHEKDDRYNISDRRRWVLGFSNVQKLELFKQNAQKLAVEIAQKDDLIRSCDQKERDILSHMQSAEVALSFDWEEVDIGTLTHLVRQCQKDHDDALNQSQALKVIEEELESLKAHLQALDQEKEKAYRIWQDCLSVRETLEAESQEVEEALAQVLVSEEFEETLLGRMKKSRLAPTLKNLPQVQERMSSTLLDDQNRQMTVIADETTKTTTRFSEFSARWPDAARQLDSTLESAPEFFEKLDDLIREGLPRFEQKFRDLLTNEVAQNLADLYREIDDERAMIKERLMEVNQSLTEVTFNRIGDNESHLRIDIADKNLPEVQEFNRLKNEILSTNTSVGELDAQKAEHYFKLIDTLVQKFNVSGKDLATQRWRERVLDVRQHMDFYGVEYENSDFGEKVVEVYKSTAGKSGGQRQKLTVTCLAAALRYQLGGKVADYPRYAAVILDEAFDKADSEFTDIALNIFKDFHFQMIIATPEKSVMTLDPYVGGTTYVTCRNRNTSSVINVVYDAKTGNFSPKEEAL